ncbi:MAG: hypothetical protein AAF771_08010 [Pseudomonadota bacterium]
MIPLFTSIPPRMSRMDGAGREIGHNYLRDCLVSWRNAGFRPITINANTEALHPLIEELDVEVIRVSRDASEVAGKPLVYMKDFLSAACSRSSGAIAITNADIRLAAAPALVKAITTLERGACVLANRLDTQTPGSTSGKLYTDGIDFLCYHSQDLESFDADQFIFGLPWWDHFIPVNMLFRGVRPLDVPSDFAFHLEHDERWNYEDWRHFGYRYSRVTLQRARAAGDPFAVSLEKAARAGRQSFHDYVAMIWRARRPKGRLKNQILTLSATARANLEVIQARRVPVSPSSAPSRARRGLK